MYLAILNLVRVFEGLLRPPNITDETKKRRGGRPTDDR